MVEYQPIVPLEFLFKFDGSMKPDLRCLRISPRAAGDALLRGETQIVEAWRALVAGELGALGLGVETRGERPAAPAGADSDSRPPGGRAPIEPSRPGPCLLPGSFNPIHHGHRGMLALAGVRLGVRAAYELTVVNADKPPITPKAAAARLAHFTEDDTIWLTRAPTFPDKARIFTRPTFVVGVDTLVRIAEPRFYGGRDGRDEALHILRSSRFIVFGRHTGATFETLNSLALPAALRNLCIAIGEEEFREDISSTEIRLAAGGNT